MKACGVECYKLPCCDFCSHAIQGTMEVEGKTVTTGPEGCKLHTDKEHQEIAQGCGYCKDFKCFNLKEEKVSDTTSGKQLFKSNFKDMDGQTETEAMYVDTDGLYTVSELIELLQAAKERWGDLKVMVHDFSSNTAGGMSNVFLHKGFNEREEKGPEYVVEDTICILS